MSRAAWQPRQSFLPRGSAAEPRSCAQGELHIPGPPRPPAPGTPPRSERSPGGSCGQRCRPRPAGPVPHPRKERTARSGPTCPASQRLSTARFIPSSFCSIATYSLHPKAVRPVGLTVFFFSKIRFCFLTVCFGYRMTSFRFPFSLSSLWETLGQNQGEFKPYDGVISDRLIPRVRVGQRGSRAAEVRNLALKLMPAGTTCVWFRRVLPGLWISRSKRESYYGGVLIPNS